MKLIEYKETRNLNTGGTETKKAFVCTIEEVSHLCGVVGYGMIESSLFSDFEISDQNGNFCGSFYDWDSDGDGILEIWGV